MLKTSLRFLIFIFTSLCFLRISAQEFQNAETVIFNGNLWGRSSLDFRSNAKNIQFSIPVGSEGKVLETRQLSGTGSYALRIKITQVGKSSETNVAISGAETWVYFSQKEPWLSIKAADGTFIHDPEVSFKDKTKKEIDPVIGMGISNNPVLPTRADILREQKTDKPVDPNLAKQSNKKSTEAGICVHCASATSSSNTSNQYDIQSLNQEIQKGVLSGNNTDHQLAWEQFPEIAEYSKSGEVLKTISYAIRNKHSRTQRLCYRYVKRALQASELVKEYPQGTIATLAVRDLKKEGFKDLMREERYKNIPLTPESSPKGAVLVYCKSDNTGKCDNTHPGHVEIKTDWGEHGGYVSDYFRRTDQPLFRRKLIAVMTK